MILSRQQTHALQLVEDFVTRKDASVFILKGYAGTGKTTLIKEIINKVGQLGKQIVLMAPTGRAAKILSEKTGRPASTIHSRIYSFNNMQVACYDESGHLIETGNNHQETKGVDSLKFWFSIKTDDFCDPSEQLFIIDESSMIGSRPMHSEQYRFGTGVLLDDLLTYIQPHLGSKILFVGDPVQLPPVGDNRSAALQPAFFEERRLGVLSYELTEVLRQNGESVILKNAMMVRDVLHCKREFRDQLCFERREGEMMDMESEEVVECFCENSLCPQLGDSIILCYSNAQTKDYNDAIRRKYFPDHQEVVAGDILQIVQNHVNLQTGITCFNGDFARVLEVSPEVEKMSAPVWTGVGGNKERVSISLEFRDVVLQLDNGKQFRCKIVDSLLQARNARLTSLEKMALYINFRIRHPHLKQNEEAFKHSLMEDPYYNAIQAKFGYAITGHKSQGGEWKTVYVDYGGRLGLNDECLRWIYTATTRASQVLYGVHMPSLTRMSDLMFNPILKISKPQKEAFRFAPVKELSLLPDTATDAQKQKAIWVKQQLDAAGFFLKAIQPCQYNDKYIIETPSGCVTWDCFYNASGLYTSYIPQVTLTENEVIRAILNDDSGIQYSFDYQPSSDSLSQLFYKMKSACDDLNIQLTNVVEHIPQYYVVYYLKTSSKYAAIQFYFKKNQAITHANPTSEQGADDEKLKQLVAYLS